MLLDFAKSGWGDIEITPEGKSFAEGDITRRKKLFREASLAHVSLLRQMHGALSSKSDHTLQLEFFRDIIARVASRERSKAAVHLLFDRIKTVSRAYLKRPLRLSVERRADSPGCWKD